MLGLRDERNQIQHTVMRWQGKRRCTAVREANLYPISIPKTRQRRPRRRRRLWLRWGGREEEDASRLRRSSCRVTLPHLQ